MFNKPAKANLGKSYESCLTYLDCALKDHRELVAKGEPLLTVTAERYACGLPIPSFQRDLAWTRQQQIRFIESAWKGIPLGTFTLHQMDWKGGDGGAVPFSGWIIDGQQRLTAIDAYWHDGFPVYGALWSELSQRDRREFLGVKFGHYEVVMNSIEEIKELYLVLAFGGTAHTEADRLRVSAADSD